MRLEFANVVLHVRETIVQLLFGHAHIELLGLCNRACVPSDDLYTEGT